MNLAHMKALHQLDTLITSLEITVGDMQSIWQRAFTDDYNELRINDETRAHIEHLTAAAQRWIGDTQ